MTSTETKTLCWVLFYIYHVVLGFLLHLYKKLAAHPLAFCLYDFDFGACRHYLYYCLF
jgi:hypothetical protein